MEANPPGAYHCYCVLGLCGPGDMFDCSYTLQHIGRVTHCRQRHALLHMVRASTACRSRDGLIHVEPSVLRVLSRVICWVPSQQQRCVQEHCALAQCVTRLDPAPFVQQILCCHCSNCWLMALGKHHGGKVSALVVWPVSVSSAEVQVVSAVEGLWSLVMHRLVLISLFHS